MSNVTFQWVQISEKNYSYSSINYLDKNVIKLFLMSCCKGGVSNSHRLPELAFVWFSLFCAWELQSLCERSPPAEQWDVPLSSGSSSPWCWRAAVLCTELIWPEPSGTQEILGQPRPRLPALKSMYHECWTAGAASLEGEKRPYEI